MSALVRRVVVTGLGLVTPLGTGIKHAWENLINNRSGIISLVSKESPYEGFQELPSTIGAVVPRGKSKEGGFDSSEWLDRGVCILIWLSLFHVNQSCTFAKFLTFSLEG